MWHHAWQPDLLPPDRSSVVSHYMWAVNRMAGVERIGNDSMVSVGPYEIENKRRTVPKHIYGKHVQRVSLYTAWNAPLR